ncbi:hybrid sensor histidine kinase/response regulator [Halobellus inordinatus]|uniref:hybrid sensor histidine kinase/response regulator n=1 Tax=Halobellus inordinatus TaxID=1126236 RepID=UPI00210A559F|nr:response regulator [Halobellus inordinatus]
MSGPPSEYPIGESPEEIRILHVDDDSEFVDLTASFLTRQNDTFSVSTSTNPHRALDRIEDGTLDCVVSDYEMPEMSGLELLERVRERDSEVPFILFTGKGSEEIASRAISAGVTDYLQKGMGTDQYAVLANRIENAVEQTRSRQALAASQRRLSRFIEQSPLGTIEYDETFTIVKTNDAATEITGYEDSELVGGTWLPIVPDEEKRHVAEIERQLLDDRGGYQSVNEIVTKYGERRLCTWYNRVVTDEDDSVITIFSQFEDVTAERAQRRELERANAVLSTLFETLPIGVLAEDADREVLTANDRLFDLFELPGSPEDVVGADCAAFAEDVSDMFVDPDGFVSRIDTLVDEREPAWNDELLLEDGRALERSYRPIELPDGQGHLWVYYDVTDRKVRERRLEALNETARELMTAASREEVASIGVDAAAEVLDLDASAIHLYEEDAGLVPVASSDAARELVGSPPTFTDGDGIAWRSFAEGEVYSIDDVREDPDVYNPETPIRSEIHLPLGRYGHFIAGSPTPGAFDDEDVVLGELLAVNIVRALEQVRRNERLHERERELTRQNARLEEFASVVSHDLRNPLNVAEGRLELAMEFCEDEQARDQLTQVAGAHGRMADLIEDLLTLARDRETTLDPTPIQFEPFVRASWRNVDTGAATLVVDDDGTITGDESQLRQLFENLFRNAVEHGGPDVTVRVGTCQNGFYVADDGDGVPEDERDHVFEYGYSTSQSGTGFGLAIVSEIVDAHGWEIRATEGTDGGARFEISGVGAALDGDDAPDV